MVDERLDLTAGDYHAFHFSEHFLRYASISALCTGKRVLDFSRGEGYGTHLITQWGASHATGVDISEDAIRRAKDNFGSPLVEFCACSAESLLDLMGGQRFDLIVSFETIEHVSDPEAMLRAIKNLLAPGGVAVISCPNDYAAEWIENPYHLRKFTFDEFSKMAESVLGAASQWFLGAPVLGHCLVDARRNTPVAQDARDITRGERTMGCAWVMPGQRDIELNSATCSYYLGVWGGELSEAVCYAPQSLRGAIEIWRNWAEERRLRLQNEVALKTLGYRPGRRPSVRAFLRAFFATPR